MQELELNYPTTKGKVYSEEEDRYLLCRLNYYGMRTDDVYERIKKDITEFPVFRFDWFFKSRSPQELQRRCNTLLGMIEKEAEVKQQEAVKPKGSSKSKVCILFHFCFFTWFTQILLQKRAFDDEKDTEKSPATTSAGNASAATKRPHKKKKA
jgi:SWI/SNF-related matrix-associated actin-dependent regulator of chromatin subfamily A member 5